MRRIFWSVLSGSEQMIFKTRDSSDRDPHFAAKTQGPLLGGCLSVISAMLGTDYCPDFKGAILVLEDIGEDFYKIDRYFAQLKLAGVLDQIAGVVLGNFDIKPDDHKPPRIWENLISEYIFPLSIPVLTNFPYGHIEQKYTLPLGCRVEIDSENQTLQLLEKGVL